MIDLATPPPELCDQMREWRHQLHQYPELGFDELRTAELVANHLKDLGLEVHTGVGGTGVVGLLKRGRSDRSIGLRADMDALSISEENTFDHRSSRPGHMHGCGHDGHTSMLLGAASQLAASDGFDGVATFIFQPAEEHGRGAKAMMADGLFERFPVDAVYALHNLPGLEAGMFGVREGSIMACEDTFEIKVEGTAAHAAMPHRGVDPIVVGSELVIAIQSIVSRSLDPLSNAVVSVTDFHCDATRNVLPARIALRGDVRSFDAATQDLIEARLEQLASGICLANGASHELTYNREFAATVNSAREAAVVAEVIGADRVLLDHPPLMASEDFGFMLQEKPGAYAFIGNGVTGAAGSGLHSPTYDFNDEVLALGGRILDPPGRDGVAGQAGPMTGHISSYPTDVAEPMTQQVSTVPPRGFTTAEFESRTSGAQRLMAERGIDALLLTTEPEVRYFTGFLSQFWQSPTRPWFLIIPSSGKPVAVIPAIGADSMNGTWLDDVRSWASPYPEDEGVSLLAEALTELAGSEFCLGVPEGPETHLRMPLADFRRLQNMLPGAKLVDATEVVKTLRMVKSEAEIEKVAYVCDLISTVFESLPGHLRCGMTEIEVFRHFKIAALEQGVDDIPYLVGGAGPGGYRSIISPPSARPIEPGDVLILDTGALFDGYSCDFDRNYAFRTATTASSQAYERVFEATDAGFAAARPGASCADVFGAMHRVLAKDDDQKSDVGRMGHGLGMQLTEWPSNTALDETELLPGMILTLEPSMSYGDGKAMVHEENILIEDHGARYLSRRAAARLPIIDGSR